VQLVDLAAMVRSAPEGGTVRLDVAVGHYVIVGTPLCTIWPLPEDVDGATRKARRAVHVGETRTLQHDAAYGIRQLVDVALRALSPGVNDPTTAQDAIFHLGSVLRAALEQDERGRDFAHGSRRLVVAETGGHEELVALAFDEIRRVAAPHPAVVIYLLQCISLVQRALPAGSVASHRILAEHARLVVDSSRRVDLADPDRRAVEEVYRRQFLHAPRS
jgi:uncharacterized membrane protein